MRRHARFLALALTLAGLATPAWAQAIEIEPGGQLAIEKLRVQADVSEGVALVDVEQTFRNESDGPSAGVYTFRLPERAVVHSFSMWIRGQERRGRVLEAGEARGIYETRAAASEEPALLEEIGWRRFRVSVAPVPAGETVRVRLVYAHVVDDDLGLRTLEIPLPEGTAVGTAEVTVRVHDAQGVATLDCPSHASANVLHDDVLGSVSWSGDGFEPSGPFLVRTAPAVEGIGLACLTSRPADAEAGTFLLRVVPRLSDLPDLPRDVVFVVDRSGSMKGRKLDQARAALLHGLDTLGAGDRFSIVSFSNQVDRLEGGLLEADEAGLASGRAYAAALTAAGGTNIDGALQTGAELRTDEPGRLFVLVFLTDGQPTVGEKNPDRIVERYRASSRGRARLFAFGVGDDVKDFLLTRLAAESRGAAEYVREDEHLERKLTALFDMVRTPLLTDVEIRAEGTDVHLFGAEPHRLPDVFRGTAVVMGGRYVGSGPVRLRLLGNVGTNAVNVVLPVTLPAVTPDRPHVEQLWARMRVDRLLDVLRVRGMDTAVRDEIVRLGVRYQVVTPYTSFLVVEDGVHVADENELEPVPEDTGDAPSVDVGGDGPGAPETGGHGDGGGTRKQGPAAPPSGGDGTGDSADPPPAPAAGGPPPSGGDAGGPDAAGGMGGGSSGTGGHGSYRGPSGEGPPPSGGEAGTPSGGGADVGAGDDGGGPAAGASAGGGASASGGGASGGAGKGSGKTSSASRDEFTTWRYWWRFHGEALLPRPAAIPLPDETRDEILGALRTQAFRSWDSPFVRSESQRALARLGDHAAPVESLAERMVAGAPLDGEPGFHEFCRDRAARLFLEGARLERGLDDATRERLLDVLAAGESVSPAQRAAAAITLGLGGPDPSGRTRTQLLVEAQRGPESGPSALLAVGLLGDDAAVEPLLGALQTGKLDGAPLDPVRLAYVVDALGRLGEPDGDEKVRGDAVVKRLITMLGRKKESPLVTRAVPAALARIAAHASPAGQGRIRNALEEASHGSRDVSTADFALIALGRLAGSPDVHEAVRADATNALEKAWRRGASGYTALASGLAARGGTGRLRALLREGGLRHADPEVRAASAAALGACGDADAVPLLLAIARDRGRMPDVRRAALTTLARIGDDGIVEPLRATLRHEADEATRLALLDCLARHGDADAVRELLADVERGVPDGLVYTTLGDVGAALGSDEAVRRLTAVLADPERRYTRAVRGLAARVLGALAGAPDRRARIAEDFPCRAYSGPIWEYMDWR